jgi:steroid 5-alpha reductase family enzyme
MTALWAFHLATRNAGWVDAGWSAAIGLLAVAYAVAGDAPEGRRVLVGVIGGLWSARLTSHLLRDRLLGRPEEGRYVHLRRVFGRHATWWFLLFFLAQGVLAVVLSLPFLFATHHGTSFPAVLDAVAVALWVVSVGGETIADRQLARFKARRDSRGQVCEEGLWAWSRHPNYFFEWLIWIAFALPGLAAPLGTLGLLAPAMILFLVLKVTGIPPTEAQALRSRPETYRRYQERVSAFFPWPPPRTDA